MNGLESCDDIDISQYCPNDASCASYLTYICIWCNEYVYANRDKPFCKGRQMQINCCLNLKCVRHELDSLLHTNDHDHTESL